MSDKGNRLRELRQLHGMTQKDFAAALGTTQPHLSAVERGRKPAGTLAGKAEWVFHTGPGFFAEGPAQYGSEALNYRTWKTPAGVQDAANITFAELEREAREQLRDLPVLNLTDWDLTDRTNPLPLADIERIVTRVRGMLRIGPTGPVPNVTRALEFAGVPVVELFNPFVDLSRIDGVSSPDTSTDRGVVAVTPNQAGDRVRFTRAHELGHLVLHTGVRPGSAHLREEEANLFAGAFLMPEEDARELLSPSLKLEGYAQVKAKYAVSIGALVRRAKELGIIDYARYRTLNTQLSSRGWRKQEPVAVPVERTSLIAEMRIAALQDSSGTNTGSRESSPASGGTANTDGAVISLFRK